MSFRILLTKSIQAALNKKVLSPLRSQAVRKSHVVSYRLPPPPHSKATRIGAEVVSAAMWWWVFWHLWHEYEHITGEFPYPCPESWSNKELGIPADDA